MSLPCFMPVWITLVYGSVTYVGVLPVHARHEV